MMRNSPRRSSRIAPTSWSRTLSRSSWSQKSRRRPRSATVSSQLGSSVHGRKRVCLRWWPTRTLTYGSLSPLGSAAVSSWPERMLTSSAPGVSSSRPRRIVCWRHSQLRWIAEAAAVFRVVTTDADASRGPSVDARRAWPMRTTRRSVPPPDGGPISLARSRRRSSSFFFLRDWSSWYLERHSRAESDGQRRPALSYPVGRACVRNCESGPKKRRKGADSIA